MCVTVFGYLLEFSGSPFAYRYSEVFGIFREYRFIPSLFKGHCDAFPSDVKCTSPSASVFGGASGFAVPCRHSDTSKISLESLSVPLSFKGYCGTFFPRMYTTLRSTTCILTTGYVRKKALAVCGKNPSNRH